jgi:hypothetical protein
LAPADRGKVNPRMDTRVAVDPKVGIDEFVNKRLFYVQR